MLSELEAPAFSALERREAPRASVDQIARAHDRGIVEDVLAAAPNEGHVHIDGDTVLSPGSGEAALRAAGAVVGAVDAVMAGEADNAFCAVRPPGHHAETRRPMGFCLFNNVAVGALQAREAHGCHRVAVVDFDVHHGNGTQEIFWEDPDLLFISVHQMPLYPGTGSPGERGAGGDNILNIPMQPEAGGEEFIEVMKTVVQPRLASFQPEFLLVSAGFDAHRDDPLASLNYREEDYYEATRLLVESAKTICGGRLVSTLEGGYDLDALGRSAAAHLRALLEA